MNNEEKSSCCAIPAVKNLDRDYWNNQYIAETTKWDLGQISPALANFFDGLSDKNSKILIPGCGSAYEAQYLLDKGFTNLTLIDIAPHLVARLQNHFQGNPHIRVIEGDFFELTGEFDLIVEQTFFCALPPSMRPKYVWKMHQLLAPEGMLAGLLFHVQFEQNPPYGGSKSEYEALFKGAFQLSALSETSLSAAPRLNSELFFKFIKNKEVIAKLYKFSGITCNGCRETVSNHYASIENVVNVAMNNDFSEVLIVSTAPIDIYILREKFNTNPIIT
ncbi:MAG: methyltransferase domain-containing protein [Bacteroidetes bacterium]|nr:methyltransferase domain-containing protein [Bacteroidota bacterium]